MIINDINHSNFYPDDFKKIYNKNYCNLRRDFTNWIDVIGEKKNLDWWISIPASRNQYISKLFHNFCFIESLKEAKKNLKIDEIVVKDKELKKIIEINLKIKSKITLINNQKNSFIKNFLTMLKILSYHFLIYFFCKLTTKQKLSKTNKIVLIDTFIIDENLNNNKYYHKELIQKSKDKKDVFFVPSFYLEMKLVKIFKIIFNCSGSKNFLLREHYLNFIDILKSFFIICRRRKFIKQYKNLKNIDYSKIIINEINQNHNLSNQILGLQNYYFFKNLFISKVEIRKVINWFENQSLGKGWNYGSRTFYPNATSLGYQGYTYFPQYMCLTPSKQEYDSKVVPETLLSMGKVYNKTRKEFCKYIKVKNAPALNYQYVFKKKNIKTPKNKRVLIILSGFLEDDISLIQWCIESNLHKKNFKVLIKEHPVLKVKIIKKYLEFFPINYLVSNKNFLKSVLSAQYLICSGVTSSILELIVQKRFVIVPKVNPLDSIIFKKLKINKNFKVLEKPRDLDKYLRYLPTYSYDKNYFFSKVTEKNLKIFT